MDDETIEDGAFFRQKAERKSAYDKVYRGIRSGKMVRPGSCEGCSKPDREASDGRSTIQAHHHRGYHKPLDVTWLCPKCHSQADPRAKGEAHPCARFTKTQVDEIRKVYRLGGDGSHRPGVSGRVGVNSLQYLAIKFGVTKQAIRAIVMNKTWT